MVNQAQKRLTSCPSLPRTVTSDPSYEHLAQSEAKKKTPSGRFSVLIVFDLSSTAMTTRPLGLFSSFGLLEHGPAWFSSFHPTPLAPPSPSPLLVHPHFPVPRRGAHQHSLSTLTSCVISHWIEVLLLVGSPEFRSLGQWFLSPDGFNHICMVGDILGYGKLVGCGGGGSAVGILLWEEVRMRLSILQCLSQTHAERSHSGCQ